MLKPSIRTVQKRRNKRMGEELIECSRGGGSSGERAKGYNKKRIGNDFRFSDKHEGMKVRSGGSKYQTDNLQPLVRFLRSNIGKHWDKVYSELCQRLDKKTMLGQHVFQHLFDFVETKVYISEGKIFRISGWGGERELTSFKRPGFYVHPKSGVLMLVKQKKKKWQAQN